VILDLYCFPPLANTCRAFRRIQRYALKQRSEGWSNIIDYCFSMWAPSPSGTRKRSDECSDSIRSKGLRRPYGACWCGHTVYRGWGIGTGEPESGHRMSNGADARSMLDPNFRERLPSTTFGALPLRVPASLRRSPPSGHRWAFGRGTLARRGLYSVGYLTVMPSFYLKTSSSYRSSPSSTRNLIAERSDSIRSKGFGKSSSEGLVASYGTACSQLQRTCRAPLLNTTRKYKSGEFVLLGRNTVSM
jgi:hypothetical protein